MDSHTVVNSRRPRFTAWIVGRDDQGFMPRSAQVLEYPQHGVADAIDIRKKRLGDDRNAHATTVAASTFDEIADGHTAREISSA
jgi:hypothetical protein